tara:strand:- start:194 stop:388 length:195 start_codon:yes stop_codon:yes gene_type:complete
MLLKSEILTVHVTNESIPIALKVQVLHAVSDEFDSRLQDLCFLYGEKQQHGWMAGWLEIVGTGG